MMKHIYLLLVLFSTTITAQENWQELFKDRKLSNFQQLNGKADFEYKNGVLIGTTKPNTPNSFLATKEKYSDFILEFEVKIEYGMNSGVQFWSATMGRKKDGRVEFMTNRNKVGRIRYRTM